MANRDADGARGMEYVIPTMLVNPDLLDKLDTKNGSREADGTTVRMPSHANHCAIQLWEVYVVAAILMMQPPSSILTAHVKALCDHSDKVHLCETVLKEHTVVGTVADNTQEVNIYSFFEEYFNRKFQIAFQKSALHKYVKDVLDDPMCGKNKIPRVYQLSVFVREFLLNAPFFDGQYEELNDAARMLYLPVNGLLRECEMEIGDAVDIRWDNVKLYDDPTLILKKYGGWCISKGRKVLTPKDQLMMRLTGLPIDQIHGGEGIPDSPRHQAAAETGALALAGDKDANLKRTEADEDNLSDNMSEFEIDPEHPKIVPIGVTLSEFYLLLHGLHDGEEATSTYTKHNVIGKPLAQAYRDGHLLAAAVLIDLYMREQIDVHHWTLSEGSVGVCYKVETRKGIPPMNHYLDRYVDHAEAIFRDMRLPRRIGQDPIWKSLEARGIIDNHRSSYQRSFGFGIHRVDVWDLARPDTLLDFKEAYVLSGRILYDTSIDDPLQENANDALMFCYLIQQLFDHSVEAADAMARVMVKRCKPFLKGELYAPVMFVHSGAVCSGLINRAFRTANGLDTQLASEAAEFNQLVMERLEQQFFLSPSMWESFDVDQSGELSMDEFVEGMRNIDVAKDFRKEKVPDDVLRMIVTDLAERLFREVDINRDGSLTSEELSMAFKRRREEALKKRQERQWFRRHLHGVAVQMGIRPERVLDEFIVKADQRKIQAVRRAKLKEFQRRREWQCEIERPEMPDDSVDIETNLKTA